MPKRIVIGIQLRGTSSNLSFQETSAVAADRETFGDGLNAKKPKEEPLRIAEKMRERQIARLRDQNVEITAKIRGKKIAEFEQDLSTVRLPLLRPVFPKTQEQIKQSEPITAEEPIPTPATKPVELEETPVEAREEPPLVIPASPLPEPMDESPAPKASTNFQTVSSSSPPEPTPVVSAPVLPQFFAEQQQQPVGQRRIVRANRNRRHEQIEGGSETQRRQTFGDFGQAGNTPFQYSQPRFSVPTLPAMSQNLPFQNTAATQFQNPLFQQPVMQQPSMVFNQPAVQPQQTGFQQSQQQAPPSFAEPQAAAPNVGFSFGRQSTPVRRPGLKAKRRQGRK